MSLHYRGPRIYSTAIGALIMCSGAIALLALSSGCVISTGYTEGDRRGYDLHVYKLFDNSRDWGPSYLVGPPGRHFGYGARVDDRRSTTIDEAPPPSDFEPPAQARPPPPAP